MIVIVCFWSNQKKEFVKINSLIELMFIMKTYHFGFKMARKTTSKKNIKTKIIIAKVTHE